MIVTGEQLRGGRAMARIEQSELAEKAGVSVDTIKRLERTVGPISANVATMAAVVGALESAGIEFTNGGQPGVRMRRMGKMTNEQFLDKLRLYEEYQLRSKGVQVTGEPIPRQGFSFVYTNRDRVSLLFQGNQLGQLVWRNGEAHYDPPIMDSDPSHTFEDDLNQWVSRAYARSIGALG